MENCCSSEVLTLKSYCYVVGYFYDRCVQLISDLMKRINQDRNGSSDSSSAEQHTFRASCLLLRGLYLVASGKTMEGLADLHATAKEDYRLYPPR